MATNETIIADDFALMTHPVIRTFCLICYVLIFISCICGNTLILVVIIKNRSMRTVTNILISQLGIADLLVGIFCVFPNASHFVLSEHHWPFGRWACHTYIYVLHTIPNASAGILVLLSIERFIAVLRPMLVHHLLTKSVLLMSAILVWGFSMLMNLPYLFAVQFIVMQDRKSGGTYGICTRRFLMMGEINILQVVTVVNVIIWYVVPLVILLAIYVSIGYVLLKTTNVSGVARSSQNNRGTRSNSELKSERRLPRIEAVDSRKRVVRLVVVIVLCFAVLSLPRYVYLTWSVFRAKNAPRCLNCLTALIQPSTFLLLFLNSGLNPYLYAFLSKRFRNAIANTFNCKQDKHKQKLHRLVHSRPSRTTPPNARLSDPMITEELPLRDLRKHPPLSAATTTTSTFNRDL
ncbi:G-PROTEIN-RECEP-F1-2 domain-containing protein [Aphelenchoides besseyi]|nr:G-PROTEIN-RECEP-F1-2 domain-containing protein [Aphelenchoides besseyi]